MNISRKILLSLLSLVLFYCVFISYAEAASSNASLFFDSDKSTFNTGDEIIVSIKVKTGDQKINGVSGSFKIPKNFKFESIQSANSILDFWINEPKVENSMASFQGVAIKTPYQGKNGLVFSIKGIAIAKGTLLFNFNEGTILADDGQGTNVLDSLESLSLVVKDVPKITENTTAEIKNTGSQSLASNNTSLVEAIIPPVITSSSSPINPSESFSLIGKGTPNALTKIQFQDITEPSFGRSFVKSFTKDKVLLSDVQVKNDINGLFSYVSPTNLVAGVYNVVPSYISFDKAQSVIGYGIKLFIKDNTLSQILIIIINALILIIPIISLILIIIFLPWYFRRRLHLMGKKMEFEEQKIEAQEHNLLEDKAKRKKI